MKLLRERRAFDATVALQFATVYTLVPAAPGDLQVSGVAPFPRLPARSVSPAVALGYQLCYVTPGPRGTINVGERVPSDQAGVAPEAALTAARYVTWLYQDAQQDLLAAGGQAPVTAAALGRDPFWNAYGLGGRGVDVLLGQRWPPTASAVLTKMLPALLDAVLADPAAIRPGLQALSTALTAALATGAAPSG